MFTVEDQDVRTVYHRAVEERLHAIGRAGDDEARATLQAKFDAFLAYYGLRLVQKTIHVLAPP